MTEPQFTKEFEQLNAFYDTLRKLTEQPETLGDFEFEKQKLLYEVEKLWPNIEGLCKQFSIPLEREKWEESRRESEVRFARLMCDEKNLPPLELKPPSNEFITLDLVTSSINSLKKPQSRYKTPYELVCGNQADRFSSDLLRLKEIKQIIAKVLVCLEPQASYKKPAETEEDNTPAKRKWIRAWVWVKELYGLTIERVTKAWLDKYG